MSSFELADERERTKAGVIVNYIIRQLNNESLKGRLDYAQYRSLVISAVKGLFKLVYVDFFDYEKDSDRMHRLIRADVVFASSQNFMLMLFTRVFEGRDREIIIKQIEAQRPILLSQQHHKG